jgi:hypothetical protein
MGYDMFPHTPHVEAMAVLDRRDLGSKTVDTEHMF